MSLATKASVGQFSRFLKSFFRIKERIFVIKQVRSSLSFVVLSKKTTKNSW